MQTQKIPRLWGGNIKENFNLGGFFILKLYINRHGSRKNILKLYINRHGFSDGGGTHLPAEREAGKDQDKQNSSVGRITILTVFLFYQ